MREGWEERYLGELTTIKTGKLNSNAMVENGKYPFFTCSREIFNIDKYAFDCEAILLAGNNASGDFNVKHYKGKFNAYQRTYVITIDNEKKLLYIYLKHKMEANLLNFKNQSLGANTRFLKVGMIKDMLIPIPPLPEQQQIVAILDKAFKAIDQAKAHIEKNIENAKELFQSKLNAIFSQKGTGWEEKTLGEVAKYDKTKYLATNRPYVGLENIESNTGIFLGSLEAQKVKSSTFQFDERHVLYGRLRPYLNKVLVPKFSGHCSTEIFPILPNNKVLREFLFYWLMSPLTVSKIDATWTGARMPRANMNEVIKFKINITSLENQKKIIKELTLLNHEVKNLELKYKNQINNLEELKKSLLQKAFAGELTNKEVLV